jgi:hypothetical protein
VSTLTSAQRFWETEEGGRALCSHPKRCMSCLAQRTLYQTVQGFNDMFKDKGRRAAKSGQVAASKRTGPVDHTCRRKSCYANVGLRQCLILKHRHVDRSFAVLGSRSESRWRFVSRAQRWQQQAWRARCLGTVQIQYLPRHDTIRGPSQRLGFRCKRVKKRHCQSNLIPSEA